jgi:hypothetical protein
MAANESFLGSGLSIFHLIFCGKNRKLAAFKTLFQRHLANLAGK